jgi:hypothetical protein
MKLREPDSTEEVFLIGQSGIFRRVFKLSDDEKIHRIDIWDKIIESHCTVFE